MPQMTEPWIVTDARLPCIVLSGRVLPASSAPAFKDVISSCKTRVQNVYNVPAFALNDECSHILCLKADGRIAFVNLDNTHATSEPDYFRSYGQAFEQALAAVAGIIAGHNLACKLQIENVSIEVTGWSA